MNLCDCKAAELSFRFYFYVKYVNSVNATVREGHNTYLLFIEFSYVGEMYTHVSLVYMLIRPLGQTKYAGRTPFRCPRASEAKVQH